MKTTITHKEKSFVIDEALLMPKAELIQLILKTESMEDDERQYWFDILPIMTQSQLDRLFNILDTERIKLEELEKKYQDKRAEIIKDALIKGVEKIDIDTLSDNLNTPGQNHE